MRTGCRLVSLLVLQSALILVMLALVAGCKGNQGGGSTKGIVTLNAEDIDQDGSINASGLAKLQEKASERSIVVAFVRVRASDAALDQLAKFPNVRSVQAAGSQFSQQAIDKLKAAIPDVQIK